MKTTIYKILFIILLTLTRSILLLFPAASMNIIITNVFRSKNTGLLFIISVLIAVLPVLTNYLISIDLKVSSYILSNVDNLINKIFNGHFNIDFTPGFHILTDEKFELSNFYYRNIGNLLWISGTLITGFTMLAYLNWHIFLIILLTIILFISALTKRYRNYALQEKRYNDANIQLNQKVVDLISLRELLLMSSKQRDYVVNKFLVANTDQKNIEQRLLNNEQTILLVIAAMRKALIVEIFVFGVLFLDVKNVGTLVTMYQVSLWLLPSITLLIQLTLEYISMMPKLKNFGNIVSQEEVQIDDDISTELIRGKSGSVEKLLIQTNSSKLELQSNVVNRIFGPIGSGKSTFLKKVASDLESGDQKIWYGSSNPNILLDSLINNILLGKDMTRNELLMVLQKYGFPEYFLAKLDNKVSNSILSGGERQLVNIARLILEFSEVDVVILDEAFSAIDALTASLIYRNFIRNINEKVLIIVEHDVPNFIKVEKSYNVARL